MTLTREIKIRSMAEYWYDCNMTDRNLMIEYMEAGWSIPCYSEMSDAEIDEAYEEMFGK